MAQKPYTTDLAIGVAGGTSKTNGNSRTLTSISAVALTPGQAVNFDNDGQLSLVVAGNTFAGIVETDSVLTTENDAITAGSPVAVKVEGNIYCTLTGGTAATVGGPVYRHNTSGAILASAATATLIPNARFESAGSTGDLVDVYLG